VPQYDQTLRSIDNAGENIFCTAEGPSKKNLEFIAASREALPKLLDEMETLRGLLREARSGYMEYYDPEGLGTRIDEALGKK